MPKVKALVHFEHNGHRNVGDVFEVGDKHARELEAKGLVTLDAEFDSVNQSATNSAPRQSKRTEPKKTNPKGTASAAADDQLGVSPEQQPGKSRQSERGTVSETTASDAIEPQDVVKD